MKKMWDEIVELLFKINFKDKEISLIVMSCCQTERQAQLMIDYLKNNSNNNLTREEIKIKAAEIRDKKNTNN